MFEVQNAASIKAALGVNGRDELWQELAARLSSCVDDTAMLAHLSGDVFAVALTTAPHTVTADAETTRQALQGRSTCSVST